MKHINKKVNRYQLIAFVAFLFLIFATCYAEAAEYNATYNAGSISCIKAGETKTVSVTVKNTGTSAWTPGVTFLSHHWYQGSTAVVWDGERTSLPNPVDPNGTITLNAKVKANVPVGSYTLKWDLLGPATWFSQKSPPVPTGDWNAEVKDACGTIVPPDWLKYLRLKKLLTRIPLPTPCLSCPPDWKPGPEIFDRFKARVKIGGAEATKLKAIQDEAGRLMNKFQGASASERASIEKRAGELNLQLDQLGVK